MFWALKYFVSCLVLLKCSIKIRGKEDLGQNVVTRVNGGDLFTVSSDINCHSINCSCVSGNECKESHFVNISNGVCTFRCNADKPTYLVHERKCVNFSQLLNKLPTSAEERNDCTQWLSVSYDYKRGNYTKKLSNVIDFKTSNDIDLKYNGSDKLFWEYSSCSIINETIFYINNQGNWKSAPLENIVIVVDLPTLLWWGVRKSKFLGKIIKVKLRCVSITNEDQEKRFCIMLKTKGTTALPVKIPPGPTPTNFRSAGTTYTKHKSRTSEENKIAPGENKISHVTGIVAAAVVVVLVLLFVAVGLFVKGRYLRKNSNEEFGNQDLNGQLHQDENEPSENGIVHQTTLQRSCIVQNKEATPDYVIPCQTKNSEMSSKENPAAAGSGPSRPDRESESEWDYEKMEGPIYQELQNRPSNSENCDYAKLAFQMRNQTLSPMQDN